MEKNEKALYEVAAALQRNMADEGDAVKSYTEQLAKIAEAMEVTEDADMLALLQRIYAATEEKISDELNHQQGLLAEYVELTNIKIAEE